MANITGHYRYRVIMGISSRALYSKGRNVYRDENQFYSHRPSTRKKMNGMLPRIPT